jgi:predicted Zn-dependent protease
MFIILLSLLIGCGNPNTQPDEPSQGDTKRSTAIPGPSGISVVPPKPPEPEQQQDTMYKYLVAEIATQRGQYDLAAQYFIDLAEKSRDARFAERATQIALYMNDYKLALKTAQSWVNVEPADTDARRLLSNLLLHFGRVDEALTHLEVVLSTFEEDIDKRLQILALLVEQPANLTHVLELIRKLLVKRPNDMSVLVIYAHLLISDNKLERALRIVNQLLDLDPNHEQGVLLYAHILDKQDKLEHALLWLKKKLHDNPAQEEWRLLYARFLVKNEKFTEGIE